MFNQNAKLNNNVDSLDKYELTEFHQLLHDSIPVSVLEMPNSKITATTKILYGVILTQIVESKYCNKTNYTLGKQVGISPAVISRYITKLSKMNLLSVKYQYPNKQGHRVMYLSLKNYKHLYKLDSIYRKSHGIRPVKLNKHHKHHRGHLSQHLSMRHHRGHRHHRKIRYASSKKHTDNNVTSFNHKAMSNTAQQPSSAKANNLKKMAQKIKQHDTTYANKIYKNYGHTMRQAQKEQDWQQEAQLNQQRNQRAMTPSYQVDYYYKTNFGKPVRSKKDLTKHDKAVINKVAKEVHEYAPTYPVKIIKRTIVKEWVRKRAIIDNLSLASIVTNYAKNVAGEHVRAVIGFLCHISHQATKKLKASVKAIKPKMTQYNLRQADLRDKETDQSLDKYVF